MRKKTAPPRLALIADRFTESGVAEHAVAAVQVGIRWVHLRDHEAGEAVFEYAAERLAARLRSEGALVSINTRRAVARQIGAALHLGRRGPAVAAVRRALGPEALVGFSAHDLEEARAAVRAGADYLFFSPVFPTESKPGHPGAGIGMLRAVCAAVSVPVWALGSVTPQRVAACLEAGARGVAVLSGILHATDPAAAAEAYLRVLSPSESNIKERS